MIAQVIINENAKQLNRTFDYEVPEEYKNIITIGSKVLVPFAKMKSLQEGYVIGFKENSEYKTKTIAKVDNILCEDKVKLAKWMARRYFCNVSEAIKLMLPPGTTTKNIENRIKEKQENYIILNKDKNEIIFDIEQKKIRIDKQKKILNFLLENEEIPIQDLKFFLDVSDSNIKTLQKNGYVQIIKKNVKRNPFFDKTVYKTSKLKLTEEQQIAYNKIEKAIDSKINSEFLIFGVTGSRENRNIFTGNRKIIKRK